MTRSCNKHSVLFFLSVFFIFYFQSSRADLVASIPGEFGVSGSGSAEYSIPIEIPPGTAGVQPELSLNYSSQGRNGLLGVGWSIGGLSVIHRCPATLVKDGFIDGIDFDSNDRFCLDGQPLIAVTGTYGADLTEYKTELDGFSKIVSYDSTGSGPQYFKVWTKSGDVMEYGNTNDSLINPPLANGTTQPDAICWLLNKVSDSVGNFMTVTYFEDTTTGENYPEKIEYTGNTAESLTPYNSVEFEYEVRTDVSTRYIGGKEINATQRLEKIVSKSNGADVREYRLNYELSSVTNRSILTSVLLCKNATNCTPATTFDYKSNMQQGWDRVSEFDPPLDIVLWYEDRYHDYGTRFLDLNGDGLQDVVRAKKHSDGTSSRLAYINTGSGWLREDEFDPRTDFVRWKYDAYQDQGMRIVELNGDGLPDLVRSKTSTGHTTRLSYINNGAGWTKSTAYELPISIVHDYGDDNFGVQELGTRFLDLNGDGLQDIVRSKLHSDGTSSRLAYLNTVSGWSRATEFDPRTDFVRWRYDAYQDQGMRIVELNGDGLPDLVRSKSNSDGSATRLSYINNGSGWTKSTAYELPISIVKDYGDDLRYQELGTRFLDLNGDGLQDIVRSKLHSDGTSSRLAYLNTGSGWSRAAEFDPRTDFVRWRYDAYQDQGMRIVELNGDGLPDLVRSKRNSDGSATRLAYINNGAGWTKSTAYELPISIVKDYGDNNIGYQELGVRFVDLNGDGLQDIVQAKRQADGTSTRLAYLNRLSREVDLLEKVTNGLGTSVDIEYKSLTDSSIYTKGSSATFPEVDMQTPMYVVSESRTDNGISTQNVLTYSYQGAMAHVQGRGFLGFSQRTVADASTGITIETNYQQDFPYIGLVSSVDTKVGSTLVSRETNTYSAHGNTTVGPAFPYASLSVSETFDLNGGALISTSTTDTTMDAYGNPTQLVVTTVDAGVETYKTTTNNTYTNDTTKWHLGRLTQATVVKEQGASVSPTRTSSFTYNSATGLLEVEKIEPGTNMELVKTYVHDGYGNRVSVTTSGAGITARTTSTIYDSQGRFPLTVTNAVGHTETREYNDPWGNVTKLTGPNLLDTLWEYDTLGRKTKETRADGTITNISYTFCDVSNPCQTLENGLTPSYFIATTSVETPTRVAYYDVVNRVVLTETQSFNASKVYVETEFDAQGRTKRTSLPYFGTSPNYWTTNIYDALGRIIQEDSPVTGITSYDYAGFVVTSSTTVKDVLGVIIGLQVNKEMKNSLGQTLWTEDDDQNRVNFTYDAAGNLTHVSDGINTTVNGYDVRGFKTSMDDPDMGHWEYEYNVLGELVKQWDNTITTPSPTNAVVVMTYDVLGRLKTRTESEGTTTWNYDTATTGKGKLANVSHYGGYIRTHSYDALGRPSSTSVTINGVVHTTSNTYDSFGRVDEITYPTGFKVKQEYTSLGYLEKVVDVVTPALEYWSAQETDEFGNVTMSTVGRIVTAKTYENSTGRLSSIDTGMTTIQDLRYEYDSLGNLTQRKDLIQNKIEDFLYDNLNRLIDANIVGAGTKTFEYYYLGNINGNIKNKSDVGEYIYGENGAGPHAVTTAGGVSYSYDANGNQITGNGRTITWSSYNKPIQITKGSAIVSFEYGPDRARYRQVASDASTVTTTTYIGNLYEKIQVGSNVTHKHFIRAGGQTIAIHTTRSSGPTDTRYLHRDHIGSIDVITDENQTIVEQLSFGAFGERRQSTWADAISQITSTVTRGFTGHEQLDSVGLIHMNGRVYDPTLGRFLSADPFVQQPKNLQSLNRYSYVLNNPLSYTDPSGFFVKSLKKAFKSVSKAISSAVKSIASAVSNVLNKIASNPYLSIAASISVGFGVGKLAFQVFNQNLVIAGAAGGFAGGFVGSGGDIKAGIVGGLTGAAAGFIGSETALGGFFGKGVTPQRVIAHGVVGGAAAEAQGGKFKQGFISSAFTKAVSDPIQAFTRSNPIGGAVAAAVVGGTASVISGGKFVNAALTNAFAYLYNQVSSKFLERHARAQGTFNADHGAIDKSLLTRDPTFREGLEDFNATTAFLSNATATHPAISGIFGAANLVGETIYYFSDPKITFVDSLGFVVGQGPGELLDYSFEKIGKVNVFTNSVQGVFGFATGALSNQISRSDGELSE